MGQTISYTREEGEKETGLTIVININDAVNIKIEPPYTDEALKAAIVASTKAFDSDIFFFSISLSGDGGEYKKNEENAELVEKEILANLERNGPPLKVNVLEFSGMKMRPMGHGSEDTHFLLRTIVRIFRKYRLYMDPPKTLVDLEHGHYSHIHWKDAEDKDSLCAAYLIYQLQQSMLKSEIY